MPKTRRPDPEKKICDAALKTAAAHGWANVTHDLIAKTAKISVTQVRKLFPDVEEIVPALVRQTDDELAASLSKSLRGSTRDRLFEIMMARFDILQSHRKAILNIMDESRRNPSLLKRLLPAQIQSAQKMLRLAGLLKNGTREVAATAGLVMIYAVTLCAWRGDDSRDMSKTMATLDRYLRHGERLADILFRAL